MDVEALVLQFKRIANIYFLVIAILQTIPAISPLNPFVAWAPLIIVIGISIAREGIVSTIMKATKTTNAMSQTNRPTTKLLRRYSEMENSSKPTGAKSKWAT